MNGRELFSSLGMHFCKTDNDFNVLADKERAKYIKLKAHHIILIVFWMTFYMSRNFPNKTQKFSPTWMTLFGVSSTTIVFKDDDIDKYLR